MSETLILVRLEVEDAQQVAVDDLFRQDSQFFIGQPGFRGCGLWRLTSDAKSNLILLHFDSDESAQRAMLKMVESKAFSPRALEGMQPADVLLFAIIRSEGALRGHFEAAEFLSVSLRVSEPGYFDDLKEDVERVFSELRFIDGYSGSLIGQNQALQEEVLGMVSWSFEDAFTSSLPRTAPYHVRLYRRVA